MGKRREARERAVQFLFQHDLNPPEMLDTALDHFWNSQRAAALAADKGDANWNEKVELPAPTAEDTALRQFADPLIRGALQFREESDACIVKHAQNWDLHRIAAVDRNILRLAIYEMLHRDDIPPVVSINEAVDIAKKFSTHDSGKFVNGILDKVKAGLMRPARIVKQFTVMFADLHLHTNFSDGTYTPEELTGHGKRLGLAAMSLTDHDTVEGCPRMAAACAEAGIEFISGTELTAESDGIELHLLGYCVDLDNQKLLTEVGRFQAVRQNRIREMVARLNELKVPLQAEAVFAIANCRSPGRPHVARALVQAGFCSSLDEAFERFLKVNRPAWVPKSKMSAVDAIALIHQAGGVAVMAHPGLNRTDEVIPPMVAAGLDGLECFHSKHSTSTSNHYLQMADQYNLLITGGSDCHGMNKGKPLIGSIKLPYSHVEKLKARAAVRKTH